MGKPRNSTERRLPPSACLRSLNSMLSPGVWARPASSCPSSRLSERAWQAHFRALAISLCPLLSRSLMQLLRLFSSRFVPTYYTGLALSYSTSFCACTQCMFTNRSNCS